MTGDSRLPWVGQRAVAWVIDDAPVPADLAWTLIIIARRCDDNGRGSYQSTATIARKAGKSEKQAQRDIVRLRKLGLLRLGDQTLVEHLPPGQRPTVYDLPLRMKGVKPVKESRNPGGGRKESAATPPIDGTPPLRGTPPFDGMGTPPMDAPGTPPMDGDQRKPLNNPLNNPSLSAPVPDERPAADQDRERDEDPSAPEPQDPRHRYVIRLGATADEAPRVVADIHAEYRPRNNGWWRTVDREGDLGDIVTQALTRVRTPAVSAEAEQPVDAGALIRNAERHGPHCEDHDVPGGAFLHPIHGTPLCPYCRRGLPARKTRQETMNS